MRRMSVLAIVAIVSACAATGVQITEEQLSFLKPGKTTIEEAVANLGQPNMNMRNPDGTRMISYVYSEAQARPATFVPIVGAFIGGVDARSNVVMLQFDRDGRLEAGEKNPTILTLWHFAEALNTHPMHLLDDN